MSFFPHDTSPLEGYSSSSFPFSPQHHVWEPISLILSLLLTLSIFIFRYVRRYIRPEVMNSCTDLVKMETAPTKKKQKIDSGNGSSSTRSPPSRADTNGLEHKSNMGDSLKLEAAQMDIIAPDGDMIVEIGDEGYQLRVHSLFLSNASPILECLVEQASKKLEQQSDGPSRKLVVKSTNDTTVWRILCRLLHLQNMEAVGMLTAKKFQQLAWTASTYECADRIFFAAEFMFRSPTPQTLSSAQDCWYFVTASYWIDNTRAFWVYTAQILKVHHGSFLRFAAHLPEQNQNSEAFSYKLCCKFSCEDVLLRFKILTAKIVALEERRTSLKSYDVDPQLRGLCLGCFQASTDDFALRPTCNSCTKIEHLARTLQEPTSSPADRSP